MEHSDAARAIAAAAAVATQVGLAVDEAIVLHDSNQLTLRLTPAEVVARVRPAGDAAGVELQRARVLARGGSPVGTPDARAPERVHHRDGFDVTLWTYHEPAAAPLPARRYAEALQRLHAGLAAVQLTAPRFVDRVAEARRIAAQVPLSPELSDADRAVLAGRLDERGRTVQSHGAVERLLHGEPHPGNVLDTAAGPLFIDFETLCRGPVEFDLAHVPRAVCRHYPGLDAELLDACRGLVIAMVAAWRWHAADEFPGRDPWRRTLLRALRAGPPWPALDDLTAEPPLS